MKKRLNRLISISALGSTLWFAGCASEFGPSTYSGRQNLDTTLPGNLASAAPAEAKATLPELKAPTDVSTTTTAPIQRVVIYSAVVQVVVSNLSSSIDQVATLAKSVGGYMQEQDGNSITVRVPAEKFDDCINRVSQLGEVVNKQIKAADITEEMQDLQIRLDNAMRTRDRLLKLLETSTKTEDTLKIEAELQRLTQTFEQLKGRQRFLESQAAYSTIRVAFNSPVPQNNQSGKVPFPWITALGDSLVTGRVEDQPRSDSFWNRGVRFDLPKSYVRYFVDDNHTEAMSAAGQLVKVQKHDNYDRGEIAFWGELARRTLVDFRSIAITDMRSLKLDSGAPAMLFSGTRNVAGQQQGYLLLLATNKDSVISFESWGELKQFNIDRIDLEKTARSVHLKP